MALSYRLPLGIVIACSLVLGPSCTSTRKYESLQAEYRALKREHGEAAGGLSRDNAVLYEEKIELEKRVSLLANAVENLEGRLAAEEGSHLGYRKSAERRIASLEEMVEACREKSTRTVSDLHAQHRATLDSVTAQIDTLNGQLERSRRSHSAQVQTLRNELARRRYDYEKEVYALERIKEELFAKLQEKERRDQHLLVDTSAASPKDTMSVPAHDDEHSTSDDADTDTSDRSTSRP